MLDQVAGCDNANESGAGTEVVTLASFTTERVCWSVDRWAQIQTVTHHPSIVTGSVL